jgi:putative ABC transport system ATP-binding protein
MSLKISNLEKFYVQGEKKIPVLQGLSTEVKTGEVVAILGQSGSGKSTLLALLAGLDFPDGGFLELDGYNLQGKTADELSKWRAKNVGIVFQQYHLLPHLTAQENVELPLEILAVDNRITIASQLLRDLGLGSRAHHFPRQMSGGECQRVAIARALATNPKILLADEPSGNLDAETGDSVMDAFFQQVRKMHTTTLLVTHNRELAEKCDRKLLLKQGKLTEI